MSKNSQLKENLHQYTAWKTNFGVLRTPVEVIPGKLIDVRKDTGKAWHDDIVWFKHEGYYLVDAVNYDKQELLLRYLGKTMSDCYHTKEDNPE